MRSSKFEKAVKSSLSSGVVPPTTNVTAVRILVRAVQRGLTNAAPNSAIAGSTRTVAVTATKTSGIGWANTRRIASSLPRSANAVPPQGPNRADALFTPDDSLFPPVAEPFTVVSTTLAALLDRDAEADIDDDVGLAPFPLRASHDPAENALAAVPILILLLCGIRVFADPVHARHLAPLIRA
ncbi:hypothetical protein N9H93_01285, partial [Rhizobiaceae bacterium]|nr:hypothetical protein [Rhizobiaceae bacterium]